ncbi:hypothetical protein P7L89_23990 [Vibrio parahaemolyticus]|nr:hypothetical protein [Vibrio parahaemolyticus]
MPVIINGYNLPIMPAGYSDDFLERTSELITNAETNAGLKIKFYREKTNAFACVINADKNAEGRHDVITKMEFNQDRDGLIRVSRVFENEQYQQVELVATEMKQQGSGIAVALYELLVQASGMKIVSDFEQMIGGKAVWKKLATRNVVDVLVWNTGELRPFQRKVQS